MVLIRRFYHTTHPYGPSERLPEFQLPMVVRQSPTRNLSLQMLWLFYRINIIRILHTRWNPDILIKIAIKFGLNCIFWWSVFVNYWFRQIEFYEEIFLVGNTIFAVSKVFLTEWRRVFCVTNKGKCRGAWTTNMHCNPRVRLDYMS